MGTLDTLLQNIEKYNQSQKELQKELAKAATKIATNSRYGMNGGFMVTSSEMAEKIDQLKREQERKYEISMRSAKINKIIKKINDNIDF